MEKHSKGKTRTGNSNNTRSKQNASLAEKDSFDPSIGIPWRMCLKFEDKM